MVYFARGEEANKVVQECTGDDRRESEQFKEGPELPLSSVMIKHLASLIILTIRESLFGQTCLKYYLHRTETQVALQHDHYGGKILRHRVSPNE